MRASVVMLMTNSPVSSTLRSESLRPTDVNWRTGGSSLETVKNECGARLSTPAPDVDETQAMGRGTTSDVNQLYVARGPISVGSSSRRLMRPASHPRSHSRG